ncbi:maleylpyruvate isomerase N-terminal domain-containing protein [Actinopolymorpha rutila]|uniref:Uncharacterized protein (TIGR03083 family) n=1 Tax=Actinopolymorpha rutila TaxID=446787 RepID=A0A852ZE84_9ACTN|nr:maleylpyruvate isomerase N-terminal domain-containing protein [Actinopolymorpha rutila]NYH91214.1 uncharacterized protein (TIGR03083 family) [Actinopolymorpha rutila]
MTIRPELITAVVQQIHSALTPLGDAGWSVPARDLEWTCRETAVHIADSYFAQAAQIAAQPNDRFVPAFVRANDEAGPEDLLQVVGACAGLLRATATCADPDVRAWHPLGTSDPAGWLAMGVVDGLVHTWDITSALGSGWRPPPELCVPAIARLFPDAPDGDPTDVLLWCTGRIALAGRQRQGPDWRWHSAVRCRPREGGNQRETYLGLIDP